MDEDTNIIDGIAQHPSFTPQAIYPDLAPATIKIQADDTALGFIEINAADFDARTMTLYATP